MIFSQGEHVTFPCTPLGRERAREFVGAQPGRAELREKARPHIVTLLCDFELKPIGVRAAKITPMPNCGALLSK